MRTRKGSIQRELLTLKDRAFQKVGNPADLDRDTEEAKNRDEKTKSQEPDIPHKIDRDKGGPSL